MDDPPLCRPPPVLLFIGVFFFPTRRGFCGDHSEFSLTSPSSKLRPRRWWRFLFGMLVVRISCKEQMLICFSGPLPPPNVRDPFAFVFEDCLDRALSWRQGVFSVFGARRSRVTTLVTFLLQVLPPTVGSGSQVGPSRSLPAWLFFSGSPEVCES